MVLQLATGPSYGANPQSNPRSGPVFYSFHTGQGWCPSVNIYETDQGYCVCVDLAGVDKDRIDVEVKDNWLRLAGHRPVPADFFPASATPCPATDFTPSDPVRVGTPARKCRVHVMEIDHGAFERRVDLPADAATDQITARYRDGFLWIDIPRLARP